MVKPAFRLRKATTEDFQTFYDYYIHNCYQWLYLDEIATEEDDPFDVTFEATTFFSKEDMERIHNEFIGFSIKDFENYLKEYPQKSVMIVKKYMDLMM